MEEFFGVKVSLEQLKEYYVEAGDEGESEREAESEARRRVGAGQVCVCVCVSVHA